MLKNTRMKWVKIGDRQGRWGDKVNHELFFNPESITIVMAGHHVFEWKDGVQASDNPWDYDLPFLDETYSRPTAEEVQTALLTCRLAQRRKYPLDESTNRAGEAWVCANGRMAGQVYKPGIPIPDTTNIGGDRTFRGSWKRLS